MLSKLNSFFKIYFLGNNVNVQISDNSNEFKIQCSELGKHLTKKEKKSYLKISKLIEMVTDLNELHFQGVMKSKVSDLLLLSLTHYMNNLRSLEIINVAKNSKKEFRKEKKIFKSQNKAIIKKINKLIKKMIVMELSEPDFNELLSKYETSISYVGKIKNLRKNNSF